MSDVWAEFRDAGPVQEAQKPTSDAGDPWAEFRGSARAEPQAVQAPKKSEAYQGSILPFSKDESGNVKFDSNAGVLGMVKRAVTTPGDVMSGQVPLPSKVGVPGSIPSDEQQQVTYEPNWVGRAIGMSPSARWNVDSPASSTSRIVEMAGVVAPTSAGGASRVVSPMPPTKSLRAAETASELGAPLPKGIATENTGVQAITQAARQLPYVGQRIDDRMAATAGAAAERLAGDAEALAGGVTGRSEVGETLRAPLKDIIGANKARIDTAFSDLRSVIDADAPIAPSNLRNTLVEIARERHAAGQEQPFAGLESYVNLIKNGASFNGMQRARTALSETIDFGQAHGGFTAGDKKRLLGALSKDMERAVEQNADPRLAPGYAKEIYQGANRKFGELVGENERISNLLGAKQDSLLAGQIIAAARDKTGNPKLLAQLKAGLPDQDFGRISGTVLNEMGKNQSGEFSLALFSKSWSQIGDRQKNILFGKQRQFYDDIANLSSFLKGTDQFRNHSNTGRAGALATIVGALSGAATAAVTTESMMPLAGVGGVLAGGYTLAKALASPAGAASVARMSRAAQSYSKSPSIAKRTALMISARDAAKTIDGLGSSGTALLRYIQAPVEADSEPD